MMKISNLASRLFDPADRPLWLTGVIAPTSVSLVQTLSTPPVSALSPYVIGLAMISCTLSALIISARRRILPSVLFWFTAVVLGVTSYFGLPTAGSALWCLGCAIACLIAHNLSAADGKIEVQ